MRSFSTILKYTLLLTITLCCSAVKSMAQKRTRILFILDASSSMREDWQANQKRIKAASTIINAIADSITYINPEVEFGLRVFGSDFPAQDKMCGDTKLVVPFNLQNSGQLARKLEYITARGVSPIAYSLERAATEELANSDNYDYSFVLLTDGGESCGGDICATFSKLVQSKVKVSPYIIGLDNNAMLQPYYNCIGQYTSVLQNSDIPKAVSLVVRNNYKLLDKPQTLNLPAKVVIDKPIAPATVAVKQDVLTALPFIKSSLRWQTSTEKKISNLLYRDASIPKTFAPLVLPQQLALNNIDRARAINIPTELKAKTLKEYFVGMSVIPKAFLAEPKTYLFTLNNIPSIKFNLLINSILKDPVNKKVEELYAATPVIPKVLLAEPKSLIFNMAAIIHTKLNPVIKTSFAEIVVKNIAENKDKIKIPAELLRPEFKPIDMQKIGHAKNIPTNSTKENLAILGPSYNTSIGNIPKELIRVELKPIVMQVYATAKSKIETIEKGINKINSFGSIVTLNTIPQQLMRISDKPFAMGEVMPVPFKFSYQYTTSPSINLVAKTPPSIPEKFKPKKPGTAAVVPPVNNTEKPQFVLTTEESNETKLQVFFVDDNNKYYNSKPTITITDPSTKQIVKSFERSMGTDGQPIATKIDLDGKFTVSVLGQKDIVLENVLIEKNKLNKIILKVTKGTLIFTYQNNRARPVDHQAVVVTRFAAKKKDPVYMKCTEQIMFEPNEYYIEVDILPKYTLHTEVSFGATTEVQLPQEGRMTINNVTNVGAIILYYQMGDTYQEFKTLSAIGDGSKLDLLLRPGLYKASFKDPTAPKMAPPTVVSFQIKSNVETKYDLKDYGANIVTPDAIGKPIYVNENPNIKFINANPLLDSNGKELPIKGNKVVPKK